MPGLRAGLGIRVDQVVEYVGKGGWAVWWDEEQGLDKSARRKRGGSTYGAGSRRGKTY